MCLSHAKAIQKRSCLSITNVEVGNYKKRQQREKWVKCVVIVKQVRPEYAYLTSRMQSVVSCAQ
eukprot:1034418-Karenia_brevis.AAC.1